MFNYEQVKYEDIKEYRKTYLESLSELQELFIEWIVEKSSYFTINSNNDLIGYLILSKQNSLIEFWLKSKHIEKCNQIFEDMQEKLPINNVLCKSFDSLLLKCCLESNMKYNIVGYMFREYVDSKIQDIREFTKIEYASEKDYNNLVKYDNELYETKEELIEMLKNKNVLKYYINNNLVGCGYLIKVGDIPVMIKSTFEENSKGTGKYCKHYDIGMWVDTPYRRKGYATKIISDLKQRCIEEGITPTCGCASDNIASKKTLEKNGFRSKYSLIEFNKHGNVIDLANFVKENS